MSRNPALRTALLGALAPLAALIAPATPAVACSSAFICNGTELLPPQGATVPANAVTPVWLRRPHSLLPPNDGGAPTVAEGKMYRLEEGKAQPLTFAAIAVEPATLVLPPFTSWDLGDGDITFRQPVRRMTSSGPAFEQTTALIKLNDPVAVGARLAFEFVECGTTGELVRREFVVGDPAPVPTTLGKLAVALGRGMVTVSSVACSDDVDAAYADLSVMLSADAQPYEALLRYELLVDGTPTSSYHAGVRANYTTTLGGSALGRGKDRLFSICPPPMMVADWESRPPGTYRVQMRALLPDGSAIATDEVTVNLACADGGARDAAPVGEPPPSDASDAGASELGTARSLDEVQHDGEGCAVATGSGRASRSTWALPTLAGLMLATRRRRKRPRNETEGDAGQARGPSR